MGDYKEGEPDGVILADAKGLLLVVGASIVIPAAILAAVLSMMGHC